MTMNPATHLPELETITAFGAASGTPLHAQETAGTLPDYVSLAHVSLHPFPVDLSRVAEACLKCLREGEPDREVEVNIHRRMLVAGDRDLLPEVLVQLIHNAWRSTAETRGAWIEIGTRMASDGERQFYVSDNGAGFEMELAGSMFEPPMSRYCEASMPGHGRGLARAARIIRRHGGRLQADSAPGRGAEFYFTV
jgi:light-regulated signal transduction histidine kinase (bacteriophytochrome)